MESIGRLGIAATTIWAGPFALLMMLNNFGLMGGMISGKFPIFFLVNLFPFFSKKKSVSPFHVETTRTSGDNYCHTLCPPI
jgi:hypothetical protein